MLHWRSWGTVMISGHPSLVGTWRTLQPGPQWRQQSPTWILSAEHLTESQRERSLLSISMPRSCRETEEDSVRSQALEYLKSENSLHLVTDRAHGSLRPLAASLCCVNSSGVPSVFHCRQSGMDSLLWPWSPPILKIVSQSSTKEKIVCIECIQTLSSKGYHFNSINVLSIDLLLWLAWISEQICRIS